MCIGTITTQLLLDVADFIYIAVDVNQKVSLINKKGCEILGYSEDEIIGKNWFDNFLPKEVAEDIKSSFVKRITKNKDTVLANSYLVLTKEGEERFISWHSTFFKDEKGEINGVLCSGEDITEKREMEADIRDSEEKFRILFEEMKQAYALYEAVYDKRGNIKDAIFVEINTEYEKLVNKKREEIIGKKVSKILPKMKKQDDKPITLLGRTVITGETIISEYFNKDLGKWLLAKSFSPMKDHAAILFEDVTEKHEMEVELRDSEEKFRILFEEMKQAYALYEAIYDEKGNPEDGIIVEVNPEYEKLVNKKREEVIGKKITEIYPRTQEQANNSINLLGKTLKTGETISIEYYNDTLGKWLSAKSFSPMKDYVAVLFEDITEKREMEGKLEKERKTTKQYLDIAKVILIVIDANENVTLVNKKGCELLSYKQEEIVGKNWFDNFLPIKDREKTKEVFHEIMVGNIAQSEYHENLILTRDGEERLIAWDNTYIRDEEGTIVATLSSGKDITEMKKIEEKIKSSEALYRALFDNTGTGMMLTEEDFTITLVNNLLIEKSGIPQDEFIGKNWTDFVPKEERENITEAINRIAKIFVPPLTFESSNLNILGDNKTLLITIGIIPETKQNIVSLIDITEQKELENELQINEERYRELFNNMSDGVVVLEAVNNGEDFLIKDYNRAGGIIDKRKRKQVIGKLLSEAFPGSEEGGFTAQIRRVWESGETERLLLSFYKDEIVTGWRKNYTYRLPSEEVVFVYEDITKEQQYLKQLEDSEEKFRSIFNHSVDGYMLRDADGTVMEYNQKLLDIYGYDKEDFDDVNVSKFDTVENIDDLQKIRTMLASKGHAFLETKFRKKDKTWVSTEVSAIRFNLAGRDVIFSIMRDISDRKKAENKLQLSEERLRNLFENIPLAISISFSDGKLSDVNPSYWKLFGYSNKKECLSTPFTDRWIKVGDRDRLYDSLRQRNFVQNFEAKRCKKDGSEFWASVTAIAQVDTSGEKSYFKTLRDITTEKQKEDELKRQTLRYQLEESNLYLSEEERPYISKEAFSDLLRVGYSGLVLSRLPETEWKKDINSEFDFFRIAEKGHLKTISSELSKIEQLIEELPSKHVIVIDRLDYLIAKNGF